MFKLGEQSGIGFAPIKQGNLMTRCEQVFAQVAAYKLGAPQDQDFYGHIQGLFVGVAVLVSQAFNQAFT